MQKLVISRRRLTPSDFVQLSRNCPRHRKTCPHEPIKAPGSVAEVASAHDVVTLEDTPGLVTGHLHGDPLWNSATNEISDGCSPQIVEQSSWTPCLPESTLESDSERANRLFISTEDMWAEFSFALQPFRN